MTTKMTTPANKTTEVMEGLNKTLPDLSQYTKEVVERHVRQALRDQWREATEEQQEAADEIWVNEFLNDADACESGREAYIHTFLPLADSSRPTKRVLMLVEVTDAPMDFESEHLDGERSSESGDVELDCYEIEESIGPTSGFSRSDLLAGARTSLSTVNTLVAQPEHTQNSAHIAVIQAHQSEVPPQVAVHESRARVLGHPLFKVGPRDRVFARFV